MTEEKAKMNSFAFTTFNHGNLQLVLINMQPSSMLEKQRNAEYHRKEKQLKETRV